MTLTQEKKFRLAEKIQEIESACSGGTEEYHLYTMMGRKVFYMTDAVKDICTLAACFWIVDLIASWQVYPSVNCEDFQVWTITAHAGTATARATDGNDHQIAFQRIPMTDLPDIKITFWLEGARGERVLMSPAER